MISQRSSHNSQPWAPVAVPGDVDGYQWIWWILVNFEDFVEPSEAIGADGMVHTTHRVFSLRERTFQNSFVKAETYFSLFVSLSVSLEHHQYY